MTYKSRPPTWGFGAAVPSGYHHLLLRPSPIAAWLLRVHSEDKPVRERFIVGRPVHRDDPTLSAAEARIQWYGEPSRLGTSLAVVPCRALCAPRRLLSTPSWPLQLNCSLPLTSPGPVFACLGRHPLSGSPEGVRPDQLPSPGLPASQGGLAGCGCCRMLQLLGATAES